MHKPGYGHSRERRTLQLTGLRSRGDYGASDHHAMPGRRGLVQESRSGQAGLPAWCKLPISRGSIH